MTMPEHVSHAKLKNTLGLEFTPEMLDAFKVRARTEGFREGELGRMPTIVSVLEAMERKALIGCGNYGLLKEMLLDCEFGNLIKLVKTAEREQGIFTEGSDHDMSAAKPSLSRQEPVGAYSSQTLVKEVVPSSQNSTGMLTTAAQLPVRRYSDKDDAGVSDEMLDWKTQNAYKRGQGVVLIIRNFTADRCGSDLDEQNIRDIFGPHGLKYLILKPAHDVTKQQLLDKLERTKSYIIEKKENEDIELTSLIVFISSHGDKDGIKTNDNEIVTFDEITSEFNGQNMPMMVKKPKVFLFQACRGTQYGRGVCVDEDDYNPSEATDPPDTNQGGRTELLPSLRLKSTPINADMLLAHATSDGTKAWRNEEEGSWFIKDLCATIKEWHDKWHLLEILTKVNGSVAERICSEKRAKQMPQQVSTLTKNFYL
ncbi:caspase-3-like [Glandiceps talaboti]